MTARPRTARRPPAPLFERFQQRASREVAAFLDRYENEPDHTRHVAGLAMQLFDQLERRHHLGGLERGWLWAGALLHDVGWSQAPDGRAHHKLGCQLILAHPWRTLEPHERHVVALMARYHRKALPKRDHDEFRALDRGLRQVVRRLAGILRVADALDRGHVQRIQRVTLEDAGVNLVLRVDATGYWKAEQLGVQKKKDLLEAVFGVELHCLPE